MRFSFLVWCQKRVRLIGFFVNKYSQLRFEKKLDAAVTAHIIPYSAMFIIRQIVPHNLQKRRQDFEDANSWLATAEILPKLILAFLLLVLPFLVSNTPFSEWTDWLWWVKGWIPVWVGVLALLHFSIGLMVGPRQLTGASIEAMAQATDEQELVPSPQPVDIPCPFPLPDSESNNQEVRAVTTALWQQLRCRITKLQLHHFPFLRFIPPAFSRDSLA